MHERSESDWAEILRQYLDGLEVVIRKDLATLEKYKGTVFRGDRKQLRLLDLTGALKAVPRAREAFERYPAGAELAMKVSSVLVNRLRPAAELGDLHDKAARKGLPKAKAKRAARTKARHARFRVKAATLLNLKTASAKAAKLARRSKLSPRTIRRILKQPKISGHDGN